MIWETAGSGKGLAEKLSERKVKGKRTERGQIFDENGLRGFFLGKIIKEFKLF